MCLFRTMDDERTILYALAFEDFPITAASEVPSHHFICQPLVPVAESDRFDGREESDGVERDAQNVQHADAAVHD